MARRALFRALLASLLLGACTTPGGAPPGPGHSRDAAHAWQEHEIQAGESQPHPVELEAGQFVRAVVDQVSTDVAVWLLDPEGNTVAEMDSLDGKLWDEELAAVAKRSGLYQLVVGKSGPGLYRLRIERPRPARETDHLRVKALSLGYEAALLASTDRTTGSRQRQLDKREEALALWRGVGDPQREAETLYQMGLLLKPDKLSEASSRLHQALPGLSDAGQRARALHQAGVVDWNENPVEAREHFEQARPLARQYGDLVLLFDILTSLGRLYNNELGEPRAALDYLQEALQIAPRAGGSAKEAQALINLGSAYDSLSEYQMALDHYQRALALAQLPEGAPGEAAAALNNLGDTYLSLGNFPRAIQFFQEALELRQVLDVTRQAKTLQNRGVALEKSSRTEEALRSYDEALALARSVEGGEDLQASILTNRAYLYLGQDRNEEARKACLEALPLASSRETKARNLHMLGAAHRKLGELASAREALIGALELGQENLALRADINLVLAKVAHDEGDLETAKELAAKAIRDVELLRERVVRQDLRESFLASKQSLYEFYIDVLMELERRQPGKGYAAKALEQSERARARGLIDLLMEAGAEIRQGADAALVARERQILADIGALYQLRLELGQAGPAARQRFDRVSRRLDDAIELHHQVTAEIRAKSPRYAALTNPETLSAARIQGELLDRESVLLEYALGEDRSWLWVVTADSIQSFVLPRRSEIEALAQLFYRLISTPPGRGPGKNGEDWLQAGTKLARMLLSGAEEPVLRNRRILVISDGALHYVPFAALPVPSAPATLLVEHNEVVNLPSASTLEVLRQEEMKGGQAPGGLVAAFGDPVFQASDERLLPFRDGMRSQNRAGDPQHRGTDGEDAFDPSSLGRLRFSKHEVQAIVELAGRDRSLAALGLDASREAVTSGRLADYRIVHFATHGSINAEKPELSWLALSRFDAQGKPVDGFLRLTDIFNLQLNADLVTLSACNTALGKEMRGEGLIGLTRGFMYAGASRVLASFWQVEDKATANLMYRFYESLLDESQPAPASALRQAQLKAWQGKDVPGRHPYYWAGFVLQGECR